MSKRIFKDDDMQARFDKQGFLVVPFISPAEVEQARALFEKMHPELPTDGGFVSGSYSSDINYKLTASNEIVKIFSAAYERTFTNYQPVGAAFLYKMPNQNSELAIHQDWTIVDEELYVALNCWVPLDDINETNGALHVVPGSHYPALHTLRAPTLPFFFSGNDDIAIAAAEPMYVKAGEAVILNQSVMHYSPPNRSDKIRRAITAGVKSANAPMMFHYNDMQQNNGQLEVFEMPEEFLISFDNFYTDIMERPKMGRSKGFRRYQLPVVAREELKGLLNGMRKDAGFPLVKEPVVVIQKKNFLQRLVEVFQ